MSRDKDTLKINFSSAATHLSGFLKSIEFKILSTDDVISILVISEQFLRDVINICTSKRFSIGFIQLVKSDGESITLDEYLTTLKSGLLSHNVDETQANRYRLNNNNVNLEKAKDNKNPLELSKSDSTSESCNSEICVKVEIEDTFDDDLIRNGCPENDFFRNRCDEDGFVQDELVQDECSRNVSSTTHAEISQNTDHEHEEQMQQASSSRLEVECKLENTTNDIFTAYDYTSRAETPLAGVNKSIAKRKSLKSTAKSSEKFSNMLHFVLFKCLFCRSDVSHGSYLDLAEHIKNTHAVPSPDGKFVLHCTEQNCNWSRSCKKQGGIPRDFLARFFNHLHLTHKKPFPSYIVPFRCGHPGCEYQSLRKTELNCHIERHQPDIMVACKDCGKTMRPRSLYLHANFCIQAAPGRKLHLCPHCGTGFKSKFSINRHVRNKHGTNVKTSKSFSFTSFKCFLCGTSTAHESFNDLVKHVEDEHAVRNSDGKIILFCAEQNCAWSRSWNKGATITKEFLGRYLNHSYLIHKKPLPSYIVPLRCEHRKCEYKCLRKTELDRHIIRHQPDTMVVCKDCGKSMRPGSLNCHATFCSHATSVADRHPCPRPNCGKSFKSKYCVKKHISDSHVKNRYKCTKCEVVCSSENQYHQHMFAKHGIRNAESKIFQCPFCHFVCVLQSSLDRHVTKIHKTSWNPIKLEENNDILISSETVTNGNSELQLSDDPMSNSVLDNHKLISLDDLNQVHASIDFEKPSSSTKTKYNTQAFANMVSNLNEATTNPIKFEEENNEFSLDVVPRFLNNNEGLMPESVLGSWDPRALNLSNQTQIVNENDQLSVGINTTTTRSAFTNVLSRSKRFKKTDENSRIFFPILIDSIGSGLEGDKDMVDNSPKESSVLRFIRFQCFICPASEVVYKEKMDLFDHIRNEHVVGNSLQCPDCESARSLRTGVTVDVLARLLSHMVLKHKHGIPEFINPFYCLHPGCYYVSIQKKDLYAHTRKHAHSKEKVPCEHCGKRLQPLSLPGHRKSCTINESKQRDLYQCEICDKRYTSKQHIQLHHRKVHENKLDHLCSECTMAFGTRRELDDHSFHRHKINLSDHKVLVCPHCNYESILPTRLKKHIANAHSTVKKHQCHVCKKFYKTEAQLRKHTIAHGEKIFKCMICDFSSTRKSGLDAHLKAQHYGQKYVCNQCSYTTGYFANLCKHRRSSGHKENNLNCEIVLPI